MKKRQIEIKVRMTHEEAATLTSRAKKSGLSREAYVRSLLGGLIPTDKPPPDFFAMMKELHYIGTALKQIRQDAHILNTPDMQRLDEALAFHNKAVVFIMNAVMLPRKYFPVTK